MNKLSTIRDSLDFQILRMGETVVPEQGTCVPVKEGLIHVWSARYSILDHYQPLLSAQISPDEMLKAEGFKKPGDVRRYILRRGMVRTILGHYIREDPEKLRFIQGMTGKPDLDPDGKFSNIRFSISRTDEMACLVITKKSGIGVDIVKSQTRSSFSAIGHYLFTPGERRWVAQTGSDRRPLRFFRIWALKEALLKAMGGDVRIMKEADVSHIMTDDFLDGFYTVNLWEKDQKCFIHESGCGADHHRVLAATPEITRESYN
jgi:4'-phosphopantetheinyl transferase